MTVTIGRRELLAALGGAAAAWPLAARAQQAARKVGVLHPGQSTIVSARIAALREGLSGPDNQHDSGIEVIIRLADGDLSSSLRSIANKRYSYLLTYLPPYWEK